MRNAGELRDVLEMNFLSSAEFRRRKAVEFPDDNRNVEAAEILDKLAKTTKSVSEPLLVAYGELFDDLVDSEHHSELLSSVGFHWWPQDATEFVSKFIGDQTGA